MKQGKGRRKVPSRHFDWLGALAGIKLERLMALMIGSIAQVLALGVGGLMEHKRHENQR